MVFLLELFTLLTNILIFFIIYKQYFQNSKIISKKNISQNINNSLDFNKK